jgi:hypothetical protein
MKTFALAFLIACAYAPAGFAAPVVHVPVGSCLANISAKIEALGMSENPDENKIDLENVLGVRGQSWTIQYYKILPGESRVLGITGTAVVRVDVTAAKRDGRYVEVSACRVYGARILSEVRN